MVSSFYTWAWRQGLISAEGLLAIRSVPLPAGSIGVAQPKPYTRGEIQQLWRTLDERWPLLPGEDVDRWLRRFSDGRTPYSRVRSHAIHAQLEAIIVLALSCGMRRGELAACEMDDLHPDNAFIQVRRSDGTVREVPHTRMARAAITAWLEVRDIVNPPHERAWLNLWAGNTVTQPMTSHTFEKLLATYVGEGWTLRQLRGTCAVEWLRADLPIWHVQTIMGHRSINDTLPYLEAVGGDRQAKLEQAEPRLPRPRQSARDSPTAA
jgi:integrase